MSFHYADGTEHVLSTLSTSWTSTEQEPFALQTGEFLQTISGRQGTFLDGIQFVLNTGRTSAFYGSQEAGMPFEVSASPGHHILGVRRDVAARIVAIYECDAKS